MKSVSALTEQQEIRKHGLGLCYIQMFKLGRNVTILSLFSFIKALSIWINLKVTCKDWIVLYSTVYFGPHSSIHLQRAMRLFCERGDSPNGNMDVIHLWFFYCVSSIKSTTTRMESACLQFVQHQPTRRSCCRTLTRLGSLNLKSWRNFLILQINLKCSGKKFTVELVQVTVTIPIPHDLILYRHAVPSTDKNAWLIKTGYFCRKGRPGVIAFKRIL
jgi:hypothetical protein